MRRLLLLLPLASLLGCPPGVAPDPRLYDTAPVALFEAESVAPVGVPMQLDGSRSYDPDEDSLIWNWRVHEAPDDSVLPENPFSQNQTRAAATTSFVPDVLGRYTIALQVESQGLISETAYAVVNVVVDPTLPIADAGSDRAGLEGSELCLDGSQSLDPLGAAITWSWTFVTRPEISGLTGADLVGADEDTVCFTPDAPGLFTLGLTVSTGERSSAPDFVDVEVQTTNQPPQAVADTLSAYSCGSVSLDGSASIDPDGDSLAWSWGLLMRPQGSTTPLGAAAFDDPTSPTPSFYADAPGEYLVELMVFDGESWSSPVVLSTSTTPKPTNTPPVLDHSPDAYFSDGANPCGGVCPDKLVPLSAMDTVDPDGDPVEITWEVVGGSASLDMASGDTVMLTVDGPQGTCVVGSPNDELVTVRVVATDCSGGTDSSEIVVLYECGLGL